MNHTRRLQWAAALPGLGLVIAYAALGWLDPAHWLDGPAPPLSLSQPLAPRPARPQRSRADPRAPAPWPDEPAMRLQLSGRGLRLTGFQIGSQRMGAAQVRLTLQWQGPPGASLEMLQALALDTPQMVLDALVLQAESPAEWRVIWRGHWQQMTAPDPLPPRPPPIEGLGRVAERGRLILGPCDASWPACGPRANPRERFCGWCAPRTCTGSRWSINPNPWLG